MIAIIPKGGSAPCFPKQACFDLEEQAVAAITAETITTIAEIDAAFA